MLFFVDEAYKKADKALGGWLPGGGTANPLSDAARPVLEQINPNDASVQNFYRENVETATEQGKAAASKARVVNKQIVDNANTAALAAGRENFNETFDRVIRESPDLAAERDNLQDLALRHGIEPSGYERFYRGTNRERYEDNQATAALTPEQRRLFSNSVGTFANAEERNTRRAEVIAETTTRPSEKEGNSVGATVDQSFGLSTKDGPGGGGLGCVYGVNKVIEAAGKEVPWKDPASGNNSVYIPFVENWITNNGGTTVSQAEAKPGDIVSNGNHMGILTSKVNGNGDPIVLSNSSSKSKMVYEYPLKAPLLGTKVYRVPQLQ